MTGDLYLEGPSWQDHVAVQLYNHDDLDPLETTNCADQESKGIRVEVSKKFNGHQ